jgi:hypothetical protein
MKLISVRFPEADVVLFDAIAKEIGGEMNRSNVVRALVEATRRSPEALALFNELVDEPGFRQPPANWPTATQHGPRTYPKHSVIDLLMR